MGHHSEPILEYSLVLTLTISSKTSSRTLPRPIFIQTVTSTAQCRSQTPTSPPQPPSTTSTPPSPPTRNAKTQSKKAVPSSPSPSRTPPAPKNPGTSISKTLEKLAKAPLPMARNLQSLC